MVVEFYEITMNNGTVSPYESQTVVSDTQIKYQVVGLEPITITASEIAGKTFDHWEASSPSAQNGITDRTASTTTYGNYYGDVTITAVYTEPINYLDKDGLTTLVANIKNELATRDSQITALQNENAELLDQIPTGEATGELINLQDSSNLPIKDFAMLGNATQETTSISGGDEYDSPSPDHPQDIHVVTGNVMYKQCGKNLFDYMTSSFADSDKVAITKENNTLTMTVISQTTSNGLFFRTKIPDEMLINNATYVISSVDVSGVEQSLKLQLRNKDGSYANKTPSPTVTYNSDYSLHVVGNPFSTVASEIIPVGTTIVIKNIQVEVGSTATTYEPYHAETITIPLGNLELAKIGDYTDRIYKSGGKWWLEKNIEKVILNGSEVWTATQASGVFWTGKSNYLSSNNLICMSNYYVGQANITNAGDITGNYKVTFNKEKSSYPRLYIKNTDISSTSDLETWLSTHNTTVYYVRETPVITEIT